MSGCPATARPHIVAPGSLPGIRHPLPHPFFFPAPAALPPHIAGASHAGPEYRFSTASPGRAPPFRSFLSHPQRQENAIVQARRTNAKHKTGCVTIDSLGAPVAWQRASMPSAARLALPGAATRKALSLNCGKSEDAGGALIPRNSSRSEALARLGGRPSRLRGSEALLRRAATRSLARPGAGAGGGGPRRWRAERPCACARARHCGRPPAAGWRLRAAGWRGSVPRWRGELATGLALFAAPGFLPSPPAPEMGRRSSDTEEESRSKRKKKHRRRSSSSSSSDSRTYSRKKGGRKSRSKSRSWSRDLQPRSHSYDRRRRHRSSSSSSYGSRRKRSRSRSRGRGKSYRVQRSRSKSRTRRSQWKSSEISHFVAPK
uniref:CLK4-associating serine/arginine rich protein-like n=1 Tax=Castor canadensis TaxID=51338 RepID=A0A8B7UC33_CASCN|nr:CLK4-associating serine/arginine rich protein-like [Castor canadensis]